MVFDQNFQQRDELEKFQATFSPLRMHTEIEFEFVDGVLASWREGDQACPAKLNVV